MNTKERSELKRELAKMGIKGDYLNGWQPREDLWRHKPGLNNFGKEVFRAGAVVANQPSLWDHKLRMAVRGILPWKPNALCQCKACRERDWDRAIIDEDGQITMMDVDAFESFEDAPEPEVVSDRPACPEDDCGFVVRADSKNPSSSLRFHRRSHKAVVAA